MAIKLVYVAGPFSAETRAGVEENINVAVALARQVAECGAYPVCPHANTAHPAFEKIQNYEFWIADTLEQLRRCDAMILTSHWYKSSGARGEVIEAVRCGIPIFRFPAQLESWLASDA